MKFLIKFSQTPTPHSSPSTAKTRSSKQKLFSSFSAFAAAEKSGSPFLPGNTGPPLTPSPRHRQLEGAPKTPEYRKIAAILTFDEISFHQRTFISGRARPFDGFIVPFFSSFIIRLFFHIRQTDFFCSLLLDCGK